METQSESLASRHKSFEKSYEKKVPYDKYIVVRIDGHKFSKYTKGFNKPFDEVLSKAMENATIDLVEHFGAVTGYTQSDEITLIFPPTFSKKLINASFEDIENKIDFYAIDKTTKEEVKITKLIDESDWFVGYEVKYIKSTIDKFVSSDEELKLLYDFKIEKIVNQQVLAGRTQKMASLIAGYTTMSFNKNFIKLKYEVMKEMEKSHRENDYILTIELNNRISFLEKKEGNAWFDARIYGVDSKEESFNSVMWRIRDAIKNSKSMFSQAYCSHKSLLNLNGEEQISFCKEKTGKDWFDIEDKFKYGILIKREQYLKEISEEHKEKQNSIDNSVIRTKIVSWSEGLTTFTDESVDLIIRKLK